MTLASRGDLLAPQKRRFDTDTLPISGLAVRFRSLSEAEYSSFEMERLTLSDEGRMVTNAELMSTTRARLAAICLCDDSGSPIFSSADVETLATSLDAADMLFLFGRLQEHCGLLGNAAQLAERLEAAKKNLPTAPAGDLPSS
jgi:hypothetical protein